MIKKSIVTVVVLAGAVLLGIKGKALLKEKQEQIANEKTPEAMKLSVPVVLGKNGELEDKIRFLATLEAKKSIKLSTKLAGYIEDILVNESDVVKKGDTLILIDNKELLANLNSLKKLLEAQKADLKLSEKIYARNLKLYKIGGVSREQLETSKVGVDMKKSIIDNSNSKIEQLNNQLSYLEIKAPIDGVVDTLLLHKGDLAVTSKPILAMSSLDKRLVFTFATNLIDVIKPKQKVYYKSKEIGEIKTIYPSSANSLVKAEIRLSKEIALPTGSSLEIDVEVAKEKGCLLLDSVIWHKRDGEYILVYKDKKFVSKKVSVKVASQNHILLNECPKEPIANVSQARYSTLLAYDNIELIGESNESK